MFDLEKVIFHKELRLGKIIMDPRGNQYNISNYKLLTLFY